MDGFPLGLGLVVEDRPTEFSCTYLPDLLFLLQTDISIVAGVSRTAPIATQVLHFHLTGQSEELLRY